MNPRHRSTRGATVCAAVLALCSSAASQGVLTTWFGDATASGLGARLAAAGDVNDDGHDDVIAWREPSLGSPYVRVISGADGAVLHTFVEAAPSYPRSAAGAGDVNDDGFDDVIVGASAAGPGRVWVYSGLDGSVLHDKIGPVGFDYGIAVSGVEDLDGDDHDEFAVGSPASGWPLFGGCPCDRVFVYSGADGALMHELAPSDTATPLSHALGTVLARAGDANGDDVPDLLVSSSSGFCEPSIDPAYVRVYSGADGSVLHELPGHCGGFGQSLGLAGDVDADGDDDIVVGGGLSQPLGAVGPGLGELTVYSGGAIVFELDGDGGQLLGQSVGGLGDFDRDGRADVLAGEAPAPIDGGPGPGRVRAFSGRDGSELFSLSMDSPTIARTATVVGDVDDDGYTDFAVGDRFDATAGPGFGKITVYSGYVPWSPIGMGLAGTAGTPTLDIRGRLDPGSTIDVTLDNALPGGSATLVVGVNLVETPLLGGILAPSLDAVIAGLPIDGAGTYAASSTFPAGVPAPLTFWVQMWIADPGGPEGYAASNAVAGSTH